MKEVYQEPTREQMHARKAQLDKEEYDARAKQIATSLAQTKDINAEYFAKEAEYKAQIAANKPKSLPKPTAVELAAQVQEKYHYPKVNPHPVRDEAMENQPRYCQELHGYVSVPLKPSITLSSRPDPAVLAEYLAKKPQPEMAELMNRPLTGIEARAAELMIIPVAQYSGPTKSCETCGATVPSNAGWHEVNGKKCAADVKWCSTN